MPVNVSRILHAGYEIKTAQAQVWFDPVFENPFSRNCYAFPDVHFDTEQIKSLKPDAIFISHYHDDHCSLESLNLLNREIPVYMYCVHEELFFLIRELGFKNVFALKHNTAVKVADLEVIPRRALDRDVDCLFQVKTQGVNILNVVDAWIDDETMDLLVHEGPWDLICWPFQTMREVEVLSPKHYKTKPQTLPEEWLQQLQRLQPKIIIPSSCQFKMEPWSWYNNAFFPITYRQFYCEVHQILPQAQIKRLNPGKTLSLSDSTTTEAEPLPWLTPVGEQDADYYYDLNIKPQSTAEIAKHFGPLSAEEKRRVQIFCESEISAKFYELGASRESFFSKPRTWQLTLFDSQGDQKNYFYLLNEDQLKEVPAPKTPVDWLTEVSETKLFAALELGESLTSMYLRIAAAESEVDVLEDPLIRCLFSEGFATYQKAQLKKIKSPNKN